MSTLHVGYCKRRVWDNGDQTSCDNPAIGVVPTEEHGDSPRCRSCLEFDLPHARTALADLDRRAAKQKAYVEAIEKLLNLPSSKTIERPR